MLKFTGIILLMSVCILFGIYKANRIELRLKRLLALYTFINEAAERIRIGEEMRKIIDTLGVSAGIYKNGYNICLCGDNLTETDISLANEFVSQLGMGDTESELKRCENYSGLFKKILTVVEAETKEKTSVYKKLGIFAGLIVGIVLI